jgi:peptidoglycan/xylan/chitin deacetylase (PgdA/CDA1 family)
VPSHRAFKSSYFRALALARVDRLLAQVRARRGEVLVLNLHKVSPMTNPFWPPLPPESFEALLAQLAPACRLTTFGELAALGPGGPVRLVLSFDDGFRDFVDYAMPILERHGVRANQNVIVESVVSGRPPWIVGVMDALAAAGDDRVRSLRVPGFTHCLESSDDQAKVRFGTQLANFLKAIPPTDRAEVSADVEALLGDTATMHLTPMMSEADTLAVAELHELGCHSYSHESMAPMSKADFDAELDRCERFFASIGREMSIFAFPNGSHRPDQVSSLLRRGVEHVLLVEERPGRAVRGVHPRITIFGDSEAELRVRSMGWRVPRWAEALGG